MFGGNSKKPHEDKFYLYATKGGITVLLFARNAEDASHAARGLAEWSGSRDFVKVKVAA